MEINDLYGENIKRLPIYTRKLRIIEIKKLKTNLPKITIEPHNTKEYLPRPFYKLIIKPFKS